MENKVEIAVVGSCNMDLITYTSRLPHIGETMHGHKFVKGYGGKGANQCVAAAKLGAYTAMIGKVGEDNDGDSFIKNFNTFGVNTDHVLRTKSSATGVASISVIDGGGNAIIIAAGANLDLSLQDVNNASNIISKANVLLCQLEVHPLTTLHALKLAKLHNVKTILNPAPAPDNGLDIEFYTNSDIICPNEAEATSLTDVCVNDVESAKKAALILVEKGCEVGIITLGSQGCVYAVRSVSKAVHIKPDTVKTIDTTGAGDAFAGALAFFVVRFPNISLHEKISRACYIASKSVCYEGTQKSYPYAANVPINLFGFDNMFDN
ncbi:ribokinase-like isoform X1 [Clavelina lepadiformis]|uniref:ribokinase-like isoform X1 n=1 Tax=Clavelina lepadiformis TaxID=159417 RepID=UPI004041D074